MPLKQKLGSEFFLFSGASVLWLLIGEALCWGLSLNFEQSLDSAKFFFGFWILSVLDLGVLAKFLVSTAKLLHAEESTRAAHAVLTLIWGLGKVVCLGLFVLVLLKGQQIPMRSIVLGMGTLIAVPLAGGYIWSQRVLQNA